MILNFYLEIGFNLFQIILHTIHISLNLTYQQLIRRFKIAARLLHFHRRLADVGFDGGGSRERAGGNGRRHVL